MFFGSFSERDFILSLFTFVLTFAGMNNLSIKKEEEFGVLKVRVYIVFYRFIHI